MNYKKYSLYNIIGALIWGVGLTFAGYFLGYIPPIADFVREYIDVILLAAVAATILPILFHYFQSLYRSRKAGPEVEIPAEELVVDQKYFDQKPD